MPDYSVERELEKGELVQVEMVGLQLIRPKKLIWERSRILGPVEQAFLDLQRGAV